MSLINVQNIDVALNATLACAPAALGALQLGCVTSASAYSRGMFFVVERLGIADSGIKSKQPKHNLGLGLSTLPCNAFYVCTRALNGVSEKAK